MPTPRKNSSATAGLALAIVCSASSLAACLALPLKSVGAHPFVGLLLSCGVVLGVAIYVGRITLPSIGTMLLLVAATGGPTLLLAGLVDSRLLAYALVPWGTCLLVRVSVTSVLFRAEIPHHLRPLHPALSSLLAEAMLLVRGVPDVVGTEVEVPVLVFFGLIFSAVTALALLVPFSVLLHRRQTAALKISASSSP